MQMPRLESHARMHRPVLKNAPVKDDGDEGNEEPSEAQAPASEPNEGIPAKTRIEKHSKRRRGLWDKLKRHAAFVGPGVSTSRQDFPKLSRVLTAGFYRFRSLLLSPT